MSTFCRVGLSTVVVSGLLIGSMPLAGQSPTGPPAAAREAGTEVLASIRPNHSGDTAAPVRIQPGTFVATNYPVRGLITLAYELQVVELFDVPAWAEQERFDIIAKFDGGDSVGAANVAAMRQMLKALLAERFNLVLRKETRNIPVYALMHDRSDRVLGPGLRVSTRTCLAGAAVSPGARPCGLFGGPLSQMQADAVTMAQLSKLLSSVVQRIVVDRTGLGGPYDLDLSFSRDIATVDPNAPPSIFTALKEQLGLQLRAETAPVEVTVVDRFDRPVPD